MKLYKPSEANKLFDGGSLVLYMVAIIMYGSSIRHGVTASVTGVWGDVSQNEGINVIAASQVIILLVLIGVLVLQLGQFYAEIEEDKEIASFKTSEKKTN
ncbi:hypothetical protein CANCADRAFT_32263 [Tortispora caseinolytica NRRL Y-17796]|uniref:Uncharacterized protein n=1 Tax=Tortispora caseinolytica NRRL Y-17796 TaxID=767744 RepID=A0A1E4TAK1_9ASCO|nr:hypothetical protein CANCADRAFT_32263 [Tortispora caseinolytica NRRL Y-17796]